MNEWWKIVEEMGRRGYNFELLMHSEGEYGFAGTALFWRDGAHPGPYNPDGWPGAYSGDVGSCDVADWVRDAQMWVDDD